MQYLLFIYLLNLFSKSLTNFPPKNLSPLCPTNPDKIPELKTCLTFLNSSFPMFLNSFEFSHLDFCIFFYYDKCFYTIVYAAQSKFSILKR